MSKIDKTDMLSGLVVLAISSYFAYGALDYRLGTVVRMGPGFVPFALGILGMVLGTAIIITSLGRTGALEDFRWRIVLPVTASIAAFALLLTYTGLLPATFFAVLIATLASEKFRLLPSLLLGVIVAAFAWLTFIILLGLPIPAFRSFF
nr:tripartite tricarboxylate transporter TctB family protein [arsenite-oxidising bacterium NT-25]